MLTPCYTPINSQHARCKSAAVSGSYQRSPQPGEIWQLHPQPSLLSIPSSQSSPAAAKPAIADGSGGSRYIMVVQEPHPLNPSNWQSDGHILSAMLLSDECQNASAVDLLIASEVTGLNQMLLAQTWHLFSVLTCNLAGVVGQRLSRQVYDLLLTVGDCYYSADRPLPSNAALRAAGLFPGQGVLRPLSQETRAFHHQERNWSSFFNCQIAACRVAVKHQQTAEQLLYEALQLEQTLSNRFTPHNSGEPPAASDNQHP